jgi:hypothetical protein
MPAQFLTVPVSQPFGGGTGKFIKRMSDQAEITFSPIHPDDLRTIHLPEHPYKDETSMEAWLSVKNCGWASAKAKQAYRMLYDRGPMTLLELEHASAREDGRIPKGRSESTIVRRLFDLQRNGLVRRTEYTKLCPITRKSSVVYAVTGNLAPETKFVSVDVCPHCGMVIE